MKPLRHRIHSFLLIIAAGALAIADDAIAQPSNADLVVAFNNSGAAASLGQYYICSINLYNAGWEPATNAVITNWLPAGVQFISATSSRGTCTQSAGVVTCFLGNFPPYNSASLTMEFKATTLGLFTNVAVVASDTPDGVPANNTTNFVTTVTAARFFGVGRTHTGYYLPTATLLTNNKVLVVGAPLVRTADVYNVSTRLFELPGNTAGLHSHHTATLLTNGLVLVVGGNYLPYAPEVYDPLTAQFRAVGNTYAPRWFHTATLLPDDRVLLCGNAYPPLSNEVYNPVTETFSIADPGLQCAPGGTLLPNGKYLTVNWGIASLYDPVTGLSTNIGPPIEKRSYHTATLLPGGKVLIAGGQIYDSQFASTDSAELYDMASGTFSRTANLTFRRREHGASPLPDGTALIAGGFINYNDPALDRAEVFDPNGTVNVPGVGVSDASITELDSGTNYLSFPVWLTTTSAFPVTVEYATAGGTAGAVDWGVATYDYVNVGGTLTFAPGVRTQIVQVPIRGDIVREPNETLTMSLSYPMQAWMSRQTATGTILDNDPIPTLTLTPATVTERDTGLSNLIFNVTLSAQSLSTVTADYFTSNLTALAGADYVATTGTVTFASGEVIKSISVPVIGDLQVEPDETLKVFLTNAQNAVIAQGQATGTIFNDDGLAGRMHHLDFALIGATQVQTVGFPVSITAKDSFGNTVTNYAGPLRLLTYSTNFINANLDFEQPSLAPWVPFNTTGYDRPFQQVLYDGAGLGQLSTAFRTIAGGGTNGISQNIFLSGGVTYTFKVNVAESMEAYDMSCLGAGVYLQVGTTNVGWGTDICGGTIPHTLMLAYTPPTNGLYPLQIIVIRDYYYGDALVVYADDVQISYPVITPTVVTNNFTNGVWSGLVTALQPATHVTLLVDDIQGHKGLSNPFEVLAATDLGLSGSSQIQSSPPLRTGMQLALNLTVTNRGPSAVADGTVHCDLPTNVTFVSATNKQGFVTNFNGAVDWALGPLAKGSDSTATIFVHADIPGGITNLFSLATSIVELSPSDNILTLTNQIDPPLISVTFASAPEAGGSVTGLLFKAMLSGPSGQAVSFDYLTSDLSATNGFDYVATNGTITFAPGTTNAAIRVFAIDNILDQPDRSFYLWVTNAVNGILTSQYVTGTIQDDDPPPTISITDATVIEGDSGTTNAVFQLTLSKPAVVLVSVTCFTVTNTALSGSDYTHTAGSVVFPVGTTNATFSVPVRGNTVNEPNETFFVNLSSPTNATIADGQAIGTILNDDAVPGRLDHFIWDTIASPKYKGLPFPLALRGVDYVGNPATTGYGSVLASTHNEYVFAERMTDDFEDGNSFGWTNFNASLSAIVTNETAVGGAYSLRLTGAAGAYFSGLRRTITNSRPNRIQFSVRASRTNLVSGRLTAVGGAGYRAAHFQMNNNGVMGLVNPQGVVTGVPYQSNRWYQVALDLNWTTRRVDCRIDGALVITNFAFPDDPYSGMDWVTIGNQDNTTSWWDDFKIFNDNTTNATSIMPSNFTGFVNGVWSNNVVLNQAGTNIFLTVDDGLEHVGTSGFFDVFPVTLTLVTPVTVTEGNAPIAAQVRIPVPSPQPIIVALTSSVPAELTVPASVTILASQTNANFNLTIVDDALLDGSQLVNIIATATNLASAANAISVQDNESATLTLLLPGPAFENAGTLTAAGIVTASAAPGKNATVTLTSSDTNVVQVPASVVIPSNQTSITFNVTIIDDQRIDGTQQATITASVANWTNDAKIITVTDNENTDLRFTGPAQVSEDSGSVFYTARISGTLTTNLTMSLFSSDTNTMTVPPSVLFSVSQTSVVFSATILDNASFDGMKLVTLSGSAPGFTGAATNITVLDNEAHHLGFAAIAGVKTSSVAFPVTLYARDTNDGPITSFTGQATLTAIAGGIVIVQPTNVVLNGGQWSGDITLFTAEPLVTLQATTTGLSGLSNPFNVTPPQIFYANVAGGDLVYSPVSERLWALVSGTLVPIDPLRQFVEPAVPILAGAGRLATASDGRYVHVVVNSGTPNVRRFDTQTRTVNLSWTNSGLSIEDIAVSPTNSDLVAISWACPGCSPRGRGVFLYDSGIMRTNGFGVNSVEFGESPDRLYGYNNDVYGTSYSIARVDASGVTFEGRVPILGGWSDDFTVSGGVMFGYFGGAFNPENGAVLGTGNWFGQTADKAAGRLFGIDYFGRIYATDLATLQSLGMITIPSITSPGRLVRWGTNGLAFVANGKVVITRTSLLPSGPPTDLALSASATKFSVQTSNTFPCSLVISNRGPNAATNALLALALPSNVSFITATPSTGSVTQSANGLVWALNTLPDGAQATVALTLGAGMPGLAIARASLTSETTDLDPINNLVNFAVEAGYAPGLDTITEIRQTTTDLAWNSNAGKIVVSLQNIPFTVGESVLLLDPWTGQFDPPIAVGHEPSKLSVHPGGRYVYAALDGESQITRVDFSNRVADLKFPTGYNYAADLAVQPDNPARVAATVHTRVAVYEDGVLLPNTVEPTAWNWDYFLEFSSISPTMLYCAYPDGLRRIQVTTNGADLLEDVGGLIAGFDRNMRCDGARVFTDGGRVFDPETHTLIATVPYSGLVAPDANGGRVFYLTGSGTNYTLTCLNFTNLQFVGSLSISNVSGTPTSLIRWGTDGLAFRTTGGQLFLIRTTLADDQDNDRLADSWETQYFGSTSAPNGGPADDPDHDGMSNYAEFRAGTDPLDANSRFGFTDIRADVQPGILLRWQSTTNRLYSILRSSNALPNFSVTASNIVATPPENTFRDTSAVGGGPFFYRLRVQ